MGSMIPQKQLQQIQVVDREGFIVACAKLKKKKKMDGQSKKI